MISAGPTLLRVIGCAVATAVVFATDAQAQTPPIAPAGFAIVRGVVFDSIHLVPLAGGIVLVDGTSRLGVTDADGRYAIDSIPAGSFRLSLAHAVLDTIGISVVTAPRPMRPGETLTIDLAIPSGARIVEMRCPAAILALRGPGALIGQVVDPDSNKVAVGSRVQLVYDETIAGYKTRPTVREATVDASGGYRICGLPVPLTGKLQVFRNGISSGQVEIALDNPLGLRSLSIAIAAATTTVVDSAGRNRQVTVGTSRLTGKVTNKAGRAIESARVSIEGSQTVALTNQRGEFILDSLPSGTQSIEVRKLGFGATEQAVELSARAPVSATIVLDAVELAPVIIEAARDRGLADLGYLDRKQSALGTFIDGDRLRTESTRFTDVLRGVPMVRLTPSAGGRYTMENARDPSFGCVTVIVDGARWREMSPGDIDDFVQPSEVRAVEIYPSSSTPARFEMPGSTKCVTVVVWTVRSTDRKRKK